MMRVIGLDTETDDPCLGDKRKLGTSWVYGIGEVLCTSLYYEKEDKEVVLHGDGGSVVRSILTDRNVVLVGANIVYDLGWLCYSLGLDCRDIECTLIDVLIAESHIDEYANICLEYCAQKYLKIGKTKDAVEDWIKNLVIDGNKIYVRGDFRKYLKYAARLRWDLLESYAKSDASLPCKIWRKQCKVLEASQDRFYRDGVYEVTRQDGRDELGAPQYKKFYISYLKKSPLSRTFDGVLYKHVVNYDEQAEKKLEWCHHINTLTPFQRQELLFKGIIYPVFIDFALIKITLRAKTHGIRMDWEQKKKNAGELAVIHRALLADFEKTYGKVNTKSSKQKAAFFDRLGFPYKDRITVKAYKGVKPTWDMLSRTRNELNRNVMKGFRVEKGKIVFYEEHKYSARLVSAITDAGYTCICNPYIDKTVLAEMALNPEYAVCDTMTKLNKTKDILDKILGEAYDRFKGEDDRIHPDLNISKDKDRGTKTGRLSSSCPNAQQIPAHGDLVVGENALDISKLCRSLFLPDRGFWAHFDYPQIEFRLFAHFAGGKGAKELREKLIKNPHLDFHSIVAQITGLDRSIAKRITFGTLYGMGVVKLKKDFGYTDEEAERVFASYFDSVPCVRSTMKRVSDKFIERGYVTTIAGRHFHLHSANEAYKGINGLDQGSSADMTKRAIVICDDKGLWDILDFYMTVHDELDFDVPPTREGVEAAKQVAEIMAHAYELRVPVFVEPEIGNNWFESSDKKASDRFDALGLYTVWSPKGTIEDARKFVNMEVS